jgi:putative flippase GtrA
MGFSPSRLLRFAGIGGLATAVYWVVLLALTLLLHLQSTLSSVIAYGVGFLVSYAGHRRVTYRSKAAMKQEMARFFAVQALCFCLGNLAFWIAVQVLGMATAIGGALLTLVSLGVSFLAYEIWVFQPRAGG